MRRTSTARRTVLVAGVAVAVAAASAPGSAAAAPGRRPRPQLAGAAKLARGDAPAGAAEVSRRVAGQTRVAVSFEAGADPEEAVAAARAAGGAVARRIPQLRVVTLDVPVAAVARVAAALERRPDVRAVTPVRTRRLAYAPNDTEYSSAQGYLTEVNAPAAWDLTKGNADAVVAVVDSGVDVAHPDLAGKVVGAYNAVTGTADVTDTVGHGTFVAGVAAAKTDNELGIAGAGFDAALLAVKVAGSDGTISADNAAAGIVWAADHGADVINLSIGGSAPDATEQQAVAYAVGKGVVVVASAGNSATTAASYPAAYASVVAVGATVGTARASFSNYGTWVDVGAPGVALRSTTPTAGSAMFAPSYATGDGTSFAAPLVAAQAALLRTVNPAHTAADITAAISESTTGTPLYGFGRGRVDFAAAFDRLPPTTLPSIVTPAGGATVSGVVTVTATSTAPRVLFDTPNGPTYAAVADGVASTTFRTYGWGGTQSVFATDCAAYKCAAARATRSFVVANAAPTITAPAPGGTVNTASFTATATTPDGAGGVTFLVDGNPAAFDAEAPYSASIETSALSEGEHFLTAIMCDSTASVCDYGTPAAQVSFTVATLHPAITNISPSAFSPNGDGRADATVVTYTLDTTQTVAVSVHDQFGTLVRGPVALGTLPAGTRTWTWSGKIAGGAVAEDGTYTVEITTSKQTANGLLTGAASRTVRVDTRAPSLATVSGSGSTFYPVRDGYRDTFSPAVTLGERARLVLNVYNSAGTRVRSIDSGTRDPGRHAVAWNGRRADGSLLPAGTYRYEFVATDAASNLRKTSRYTVTLSAKRLEARTGTKVLSPAATMTGSFVGDCSEATTPAAGTGWTGSIGYYSDYYDCSYYELDDLVMTEHAFTLPAAIKYGNVRIGGTGKEAVNGYGDRAALVYLDAAADVTDYGAGLGSAYGTYWGDSVPLARIGDGRRLQWIVGTTGVSFYHLRTLSVRWVYYVLV